MFTGADGAAGGAEPVPGMVEGKEDDGEGVELLLLDLLPVSFVSLVSFVSFFGFPMVDGGGAFGGVGGLRSVFL